MIMMSQSELTDHVEIGVVLRLDQLADPNLGPRAEIINLPLFAFLLALLPPTALTEHLDGIPEGHDHGLLREDQVLRRELPPDDFQFAAAFSLNGAEDGLQHVVEDAPRLAVIVRQCHFDIETSELGCKSPHKYLGRRYDQDHSLKCR